MEALKKKILDNLESFDTFLRENFDFSNVFYLHKNVLKYEDMEIDEDFEYITLTLHSCDEIEDHINISLKPIDGSEKEYTWEGITLFIYHFVDEMD